MSFVACLALATGCTDDLAGDLSELQVDNSYVAIDEKGGSSTITVTAEEAWSFSSEEIPEWLTITPTSGNAGVTKVTFSAEAAKASQEVTLKIYVGSKVQYVNVTQQVGEQEVVLSTCADVIAGQDGKTFLVEGVCTSISNTQYGNWYLQDATGTIYIYGTLDANGAYNWSSLGIEVGDIVRVKGPKTTYGSTIELVDVKVISVVKSLIKVDSDPIELTAEGGDFEINLTCKGDGVSVIIPDEAKSWLTITGITTSGTTAVVKMNATPNKAGNREVNLTFTTTSSGNLYTAETSVKQKGTVVEATIAEALESMTLSKISGTVVATGLRGYILADNSAAVYVYWGSSYDKGYAIGDQIDLIGTVSIYNKGYQINGTSGDVESEEKVGHEDYTQPTPKYLTGAALDAIASTSEKAIVSQYVQVVGTPTGSYGNITIEEGTNTLASVYPTDELNPKNFLDKEVTVTAYLTSISSGRVNAVIVSIQEGVHVSTYKKVTEIKSGKTYLLVAKLGDGYKAATNIPSSKKYGYPGGTDVTPSSDVIKGSYESCEWTITSTSGDQYTICQADGRYIYQSGKYNSFNVASEPTEGNIFTLTKNEDDTFKILNVGVSKWMQLDSSYGTYGSYDSEKGAMPVLYEKQ